MKIAAKTILLALACLALLSGPALANYMGDIELDRGSCAWLGFDDQVHVSLSYKVTEAEGARIRILPYTNGSITPNCTWGGTPIYFGEGVCTHWFTVSSQDVVVDQCCVRMYSPDWTELLLELFIPVEYHYGDHGIYNIEFSYGQPSWIANGQDLDITFDYTTSEVDGVLIFARPYYQGNLCSGYVASGSPVHMPPGGSGTQNFTFPAGDREVDEVRFYMKTADHTVQLLEFFVPVEYYWRANGLMNFSATPVSPQHLPWPERATIDLDYYTTDPDGVLIWVLAAHDGHTVAGQAYQGSVVEPGPSGHLDRYFYFFDIEAEVTQFRIVMKSGDQSVTYLDVFVPINYHWAADGLMNVELTPGAPAILTYDEFTYVTFDYTATDPDGVRIYNIPCSQGSWSPGLANNASPLYYGSGSDYGYFLIQSGEVLVDQVNMLMRNADQSVDYLDFQSPAWHYYGTSAVVTDVSPPAPLALARLMPNYPNPFNPSTTLSFHLAEASAVELAIYDVQGRKIRELLAQPFGPGDHEIVWDGRNEAGQSLPSGVYLARFQAGRECFSQKLVLMK